MMISLIVAQTRNRVIGSDGKLPWSHLKSDMVRFKLLTQGHPVVMGRKTWESLPARFRPLPGRTNVVVTRNESYQAEGARIFGSVKDALDFATLQPGGDEVFVIGGAEIYSQSLEYADRIYLTIVEVEGVGESLFPLRDDSDWNMEKVSSFERGHDNEYDGTFYTCDRIQNA